MDKDNVRHTLTYHNSNFEIEKLVVYVIPDRKNTKAVEVLRKKAETFKSNIHSGHLSCYYAWVAMNTTILKTLQYPLPALTLTESECNHIMALIFCLLYQRLELMGELQGQSCMVQNTCRA